MEYEQAVQAFFNPVKAITPIQAVSEGSPARRLRDAVEPIAMHAVWSPLTNQTLAEHGLNFLTAYVWGRAAALGEAPATLVIATFAAFEPNLITALYEEGRQKVSRADLLRLRDEATIKSLTAVIGDEDVSAIVAILRRGIEAADPTGRSLFAALMARPFPDDPIGQLWRVCDLIREYRGDSHIAAYITAGFNPVEMNILTELYLGMSLGQYSASRAWSEAATAAALTQLTAKGLIVEAVLTEKGHTVRAELERQTDAMQQSLVEAIGSDLEGILQKLNSWSEKCLEAKAFPPDDYKRAAG